MVLIQDQRPHLTWDPRQPFPYESSWLIFSKILLTNALTTKYLYNLISNHHFLSKPKKSNVLQSSDWINIRTFSTLLGINDLRLMSGFIDTYGFTTEVVKDHLLWIKHCSECKKHGYHNTFFNLGFVTHCPWHNVPLEHPCRQCKKSLNTTTQPLSSHRFECEKCHFTIDLTDNIAGDLEFLNTYGSRIVQHSQGLIGWLTDMRQSTPHAQSVLDELAVSTGYVYASNGRVIDLILQSLNPQYRENEQFNAWRPAKYSFQERLSVYIHRNISPTHAETKVADMSELKACYGSLRRHLFNKYLKRHRRCYRAILKGLSQGINHFDTDQTCMLSMTFILWRMDIEDKYSPNSLLEKKEYDFYSLHFYPYDNIIGRPMRDVIHLQLKIFYIWWYRLAFKYRKHNFEVSESTLSCGIEPTYDIVRTQFNQYYLFPDIDYLTKQAKYRCDARLGIKAMFRGHFQKIYDRYDFTSNKSKLVLRFSSIHDESSEHYPLSQMNFPAIWHYQLKGIMDAKILRYRLPLIRNNQFSIYRALDEKN